MGAGGWGCQEHTPLPLVPQDSLRLAEEGLGASSCSSHPSSWSPSQARGGKGQTLLTCKGGAETVGAGPWCLGGLHVPYTPLALPTAH